MMSNPYLSEKLAQAHREDLLREAEQQRLVAQLSEPGRSRHILASSTGVVLASAKLRYALCETLSGRARQGDVVLVKHEREMNL
jgi:UDP-N-acetylmuramyl pentapeptide synthase